MMTDNELDNLFKNTLGSHEAPVPAGMWQRVQPAEKKRRVVFWWKWYAVAAVFLIAGIAAFWLAKPPAQESSANSATSSSTRTDSLEAQPVIKNNNKHEPLQNSQTLQADKKSNTGHFTYPNNNPFSSPATGKNQKASGKYLNDNSSSTDQNRAGTNNSIYSNKNKELTDLMTAKSDSDLNTKKAVAENSVAINDTAKPSLKENNSPETIKKDDKNKFPWTIEFFTASAYSDKQTYSVQKESTFIPGAIIQKPLPKPSLWSYGAGVRMGIPVTKKMTLKTGVQFLQTRQKIAYQQETVNSFISVNAPADTSILRQIIYQTQNQQSTYNSISVPLLITYQTSKKIQAGITAGAIVNVHSWYKGKIPDAAGTATLKVKDVYKPATGTALFLSLSAAKKMGPVELFAEPYMQYSLNSFTKKTIPFKQKINSYGLNIGVRTALHK